MAFPEDDEQVKRLIRLAIEEDLGEGDVTTESAVPEDARARANVVARQAGIVAGLPLIELIVGHLTSKATVTLRVDDGDHVRPSDVLATIEGPAGALLTAERVMLNFVRHLSGIATLTRTYVDAIAGTKARVYDTRKTTPGFRVLEKYAVRVGGAENHRMGLFDEVLIKDNHLAILAERCESLTDAVKRIRRKHPDIPVEIEADTEEGVRDALKAEADILLLDNMPPDRLYRAVKLARELSPDKRPLLEASGGITLETIRAVALAGVDRISVGAITHSAHAFDIAVDFEAEGCKS